MPAITRAQIDRRLSFLRSAGCDLAIDKDGNGYRIQTANGDRNLSPRMKSTRETINWLEAYETGYEMGKEAGRRPRTETHIDGCDCETCSANRMRAAREARDREA